jgi:DNA-directed RNA polymerase specialized sigma24 family protein
MWTTDADWEQIRRLIYRSLLQQGLNDHDADDLTSEVLLAARNWLAGCAPLLAYLRQTAANQRNRFFARRRTFAAIDTLDMLPNTGQEPVDELIEDEEWQMVWRAMASLPANDRIALEDYGYALLQETATKINLTTDAASKVRQRALKKVRVACGAK